MQQQDTTGNEDGGLGSLGSDDLLMIIIGGAVILVVLLMAYYITRRMRSLKTTGMTGIAKMVGKNNQFFLGGHLNVSQPVSVAGTRTGYSTPPP